VRAWLTVAQVGAEIVTYVWTPGCCVRRHHSQHVACSMRAAVRAKSVHDGSTSSRMVRGHIVSSACASMMIAIEICS
jgi:hypothetical protein